VKIASSGPVLFRQERIGHNGVRFLCLKFRTMKVNSSTAVHQELLHQLMTSDRPMKKLDATGDSRLIPGGLWLRAFGLDELPQIINILRGEMSFVGPRPNTTYEFKMLQAQYRRRCGTLPGLTGLWQVNGKNHIPADDGIGPAIRGAKVSLAGLEDSGPHAHRRPAAMLGLGGGKENRPGKASAMPVRRRRSRVCRPSRRTTVI
jgi:lipopolysaccharide/colanic/teichoic acid biosynthesis glycosyltransferase